MVDVKGLFKNITRTKPFSDMDLDAAHNAANTFIETVLEADVDKTYSVRILFAYCAPSGLHVVVVEYSYLENVPQEEIT